MFRYTLIALSLCFAPAHAGELYLPDKSTSLAFEISDKKLLQEFGKANEGCRGGNPDRLEMWLACARRDVLSAVMDHRNYCFGKKGDMGASTMYWHKCGPSSLR